MWSVRQAPFATSPSGVPAALEAERVGSGVDRTGIALVAVVVNMNNAPARFVGGPGISDSSAQLRLRCPAHRDNVRRPETGEAPRPGVEDVPSVATLEEGREGPFLDVRVRFAYEFHLIAFQCHFVAHDPQDKPRGLWATSGASCDFPAS